MGKGFIDLHIHSSLSSGLNSKSELTKQAAYIGTEIRFCDGSSSEEGQEIIFKSKQDLKKQIRRNSYLILEPTSKEAFQAAVNIKHSIIRTALSPTSAKIVAKAHCAIEVSLFPLFQTANRSGSIRAIKNIRKNLKFARKFGVPMVATTGSNSIYDLKSPNQIFSLLLVLGFTENEANDAMFTTPNNILMTQRDKLENRFISVHVRKA